MFFRVNAHPGVPLIGFRCPGAPGQGSATVVDNKNFEALLRQYDRKQASFYYCGLLAAMSYCSKPVEDYFG